MNRNSIFAITALAAALIVQAGCSQPEVTEAPVAAAVIQLPPIEGGLVFDAVLQSSDVEMFPTFADINSDTKPDLILGTIKDVSIQLNQSADQTVSFAAAYKPKSSGENNDIPWG